MAAKKHSIRALNRLGDSVTLWTEDSPAEIAAAADEFLRLRGAGATMFAVGVDEATGEKVNRRLDAFEPTLAEENVVAIYQVQGGVDV